MKGTFSALKINNKIQKKMRIQGYKTPIFPPPRNEGLNKGLLTTKSGGFPGEKALFSKKLEIFHGSFCPNLLVLDGFTLRCCGRSLALPHSQGWLCGGLVQNHPEMSGLCWDMLGYVGFGKNSNLLLAKTHNFRKAMRKNYIHVFKTRCMEAWMVHRPFAFLGRVFFTRIVSLQAESCSVLENMENTEHSSVGFFDRV